MKTLNRDNTTATANHNWSRLYTYLSFIFTGIIFFLFGYFFEMITVL
ncbi:MAG: hypothetical protein IJ753_02075 [Bacteroidales bacterium]|nr:hypothetical protein [Bacteroidales bacterium]